MENKGWVKLWREQFINGTTIKPFCDGYAWCYLYSQANYEPKTVSFRNEYIDVKRGQFVISKLKLQEIFGWTYRHVPTFLDVLKCNNRIIYRTSNRFIVITIVNYNEYQGSDEQTVEQTVEQNDMKEHITKKSTYTKKRNTKEKKKFLDSIYLTTDEYEKLINEYGEKIIKKNIENLQRYIAKTGREYNSHYLTIKAWIRKEKRESEIKDEKFDNGLPEPDTMVDLRKELEI